VVAGRVDMLAWVLANLPNGTEMASMRTALKALHFDLAGAPVEEQLGALLAVADPSKFHYGSDFPFTPTQACGVLMQQLQTSRNLDDSDLVAVLRDNSYDLLRIACAPSRNES
jgi:6-methylsalicylate decarboxylase